MKLIPMPRFIRQTREKITNKSVAFQDSGVDKRLAKAIAKLPAGANGLPLIIQIGGGEEESYTLDLTNSAIVITASAVVGAFYGVQTLRQILENEEVYACHIEDAPAFASRGFYHDVTRGRVPKLDTLKELVDHMAYMKLNSLQLYVEHTFAFREYADSLDATGYLTADEIRELDAYCYENFIELIPSLSCFGHLYVLLEKPQYQHLQEAQDYHQEHLYWQERMGHHTIDPTNPESFLLIKSLIQQFMPLFRSNKFNICCDETFDLQNGKHKDLDTGKLYVSFVTKLIDYVKSCGKEVMMWGDILLQHPECVAQIPEDVILLNWYYDADAEIAEEKIKAFYHQNRAQIACPATWAWNHFSESLVSSIPNITHMTKLAKQYGAKGILNTNWGDYGDPCSFDLSLFGLAYGAARSWNVSTEVESVKACGDFLIYRHEGAFRMLYALSEVEQTVHYGELSWMYNNLYYPGKFDLAVQKQEALLSARGQCLDLLAELRGQVWERDIFRQEIMIAAEGVAVMAELMMALRGYPMTRQTVTGEWLKKYRASWLHKNQESELKEIEKMFCLLENSIAAGTVLS